MRYRSPLVYVPFGGPDSLEHRCNHNSRELWNFADIDQAQDHGWIEPDEGGHVMESGGIWNDASATVTGQFNGISVSGNDCQNIVTRDQTFRNSPLEIWFD